MLREIELAALVMSDVGFLEGAGCGVATIHIGASKTDSEAQGVSRQLKCACDEGCCPVSAVRRLCLGRQPFQHLVRARNGSQVDKETLVCTMKEHAQAQGLEDVSRITGHSMRATGAQRWAAKGVELEVIRLFGRWKSTKQLMKYVRDAALMRVGASSIESASRPTARRASRPSATHKCTKWQRLARSG